jgi:hypothetical protein
VDQPQRLQSWAILAAVVVATAAPTTWAAKPAAIGQTPVERMIDLNRKAFADIQKQHFQAAKYWLTEALVISETAGLENDEMTARTYVHLAVLYLTGLEDRAEAIRYFTLALKINPNITMSAGLETPALKAAYLEAREEMGLPPSPDPTAAVATPTGQRAAAPPSALHQPLPHEPLQKLEQLDPDLPARVPTPLFCSVPFEIPAEQDLLVRCLTQKRQKRSSATLYFRVEGTTTKYTALPMAHSPKGWLVAVIPGQEIRGRSLSYFVKAQLPGSTASLYSGYPEAPKALLIKPPPAATDEAAARLGPVTAPAAANGGPRHRRPVGAVWLALGGGTGTVYHGREAVDTGTHALGTTNPVYVGSGFSAATLLHIEPEIGYQLTPRLSLSLLLRYQYAPSSGAAFVPEAGQHAILTSAFAGFARVQLSLGSSSRVQPYLSAGAGGGRSFLAVVGKQCAPGQCGLDHSDTLHGGPVGLLAGLGLIYHLSSSFGLLFDLKEIVTLPKVMALTEFAVGFQVAHDFRAPAAPGRTENEKPVAIR